MSFVLVSTVSFDLCMLLLLSLNCSHLPRGSSSLASSLSNKAIWTICPTSACMIAYAYIKIGWIFFVSRYFVILCVSIFCDVFGVGGDKSFRFNVNVFYRGVIVVAPVWSVRIVRNKFKELKWKKNMINAVLQYIQR